MKFEELYKKSVKLWPDEIDVSDGRVEDNGIFFQKLSSVWYKVETESKLMGEWHDLMAWVIFSNFHHMATLQLKKGKGMVRKVELQIDKIKSDLMHSLMADGYEDMLDTFRKLNST